MNKPRTIHGRGRYSDIVWKSLILDEPFMGYTRVDFMYYRILPEELHNPDLKPGMRDWNHPDIDRKGSGNIHPSRDRVEQANRLGQIRQLVLMHRVKAGAPFGPALSDGQECEGKTYKLCNAEVLAANYYPPIEPIENPTPEDIEKQNYLKKKAEEFGCPML